ncbi:hypothetical protein V8C26DRAFT_386571 [Trichoderma gracile]
MNQASVTVSFFSIALLLSNLRRLPSGAPQMDYSSPTYIKLSPASSSIILLSLSLSLSIFLLTSYRHLASN